MAQLNYFVGQSVEWLEAQLQQVQEDLAAGKTLIQWGAGDSSGIRKVQLTPQYRFQLLYYALSQLDPDTYPVAAQVPRNRTKAVFS
jgi:hypothetical protein